MIDREDEDWDPDEDIEFEDDEPEPQPEPESTIVEPQAAETPEPELHEGQRRFIADVTHDVDQIEQRLGRALTNSERYSLASAALDQAGRHDHIDLSAQAEQLKRVEDMSGSERAGWMTERVRDSVGETDLDRRVKAIEESGGFDVTDPEHRRVYVEARAAGYDAEDVEE
jgi:hypothetical protein